MILFYDFEVFKHDWLVVAKDPCENRTFEIVNNRDELAQLYEAYKDSIWVGFNNTHYDQYILQGILAGFNPKEVNDWIIRDGQPGYRFDPSMSIYKSYQYDVMERMDKGLKTFEGYMGISIEESSVPFDIQRKLTKEEIKETFFYCNHDVDSTIEVFMERIDNFHAVMSLITEYKLPLYSISKTKPGISADILGAVKKEHNDADEISLPPTRKIKKYWQVEEFFQNWKPGEFLDLEMAGMIVSFGIGGGHGALKKYHEKGYFLLVDVDSLYPSLQLRYPEYCWSRNTPKDAIKLFAEIRETRLKLKRAGKKKEQAPYKILLNATYGITKDKYSKMYDPRQASNTCVFGMILVCVDLLERLEESGVCKLIQVNTDGILIKLNRDEDYDTIDDICYEWEKRTGLTLGFDYYGYSEVFQKDVSNYLVVGEDGHVKAKGKWLRERTRLENDMSIVQKALMEKFIHGVPVEKTINECDSLMEFQMVKKVSNKYEASLYHGGVVSKIKGKNVYSDDGSKLLKERCVRVFATKDERYGGLYKKKKSTGQIAKVDETPPHSMIVNGDITNAHCPTWLDKQWYINLANERVRAFGIS